MIVQTDFTHTVASGSPLTESARWVLELLTGPAATIVAVIAVAMVGFALLQGRIDLNRGASVIIGIFVVFGAPAIASALLALTQLSAPPMAAVAATPIIPVRVGLPAGSHQSVYDPYAGAALPNNR